MKKGIKKSVFRFNCSDFLRDNESGLYVEDYFHELIYLERKRCERLKGSFVLMLLDVSELHYAAGMKAVIKGVSAAAAALTRETDIKGWYECGFVIGVLFTGTGREGIEHLRKKIRTGLDRSFDGEVAGRISISVHAFPEDAAKDGPSPDLALYPEVAKKNADRKGALTLKRSIDIALSLSALALLAPVLAVIGVLIKTTSRGPVLFRQTRIGQLGRPFTFLKFRSMYNGSNEKIHSDYVRKLINEGAAYSAGEKETVYKIKDDPRITPLGRILRRTSLDELPQFINVLRGEMSLVGPRPPLPYEIEMYDIWHLRRIIDVRPGITGLWQVKGRSRTNFNEMVRMDISYIREWSIWLDLKLLFMTPWALITTKGAY